MLQIKKTKYFILLMAYCANPLLFSQTVDLSLESIENSQTTLESQLELNDEGKAEITGDFSGIDALHEHIEAGDRRHKFFRKEKTKKITLSSPQTFHALLKKGSVIIDTETNRKYQTHQSIYCLVKEKSLGNQMIYILDENEKIRYQTYFDNIISIKDDLDLNPHPSNYTTYSPRITDDRKKDTTIVINNSFIYGQEFTSSNYFSQMFNEEASASRITQIKYNLLYKSVIPINIGLTSLYQNGGWKSTTTEFNWTSLFIGPMVNGNVYNSGNGTTISPYLSFCKSVFFQSKKIHGTSTTTHQFSANMFEIGMEVIITTKIGNILLGGNYQKYIMAIKTDDSNQISYSPIKGNFSGFGLQVGYNFDLNI